jgi:hypothetical protein
MAVSMKMAIFWVVAPCSLVEVYQCFRGPSEDLWSVGPSEDLWNVGPSEDLWNVGKRLPDYMALQPGRQPSSNIKMDHKRQSVRVWIRLIWPRIGFSGWFLWTWYHKSWEISCLHELLSFSLRGLCPVEFVSTELVSDTFL